ncbi:hypothetical protein [Ekhidna sp.]|uniref:hypothetical protein n=1 Tax=Ekhidna sp. TaxID=2608089 RepID=UPI003B51370F
MKILPSLVFMIMVFTSCSSDGPINMDQEVIISQSLYNQTNTDSYTIENAAIDGDLLILTIQSSGCDGSDWVIKLIDSGAIAESYPVQRFGKIALENEELCDAIVSREYSIDISSLRVEDQLYLNLEGWEGQLHYKF